MSLTQKQSFYLSLIQQAEAESKSLQAIALEYHIKPANLYAGLQSLRQKGILPSGSPAAAGFARVEIEAPASGQHIELKTQLPNGQLIWMSVPANRLRQVMQVLSA